jgi:SNW domain-containing protein 1
MSNWQNSRGNIVLLNTRLAVDGCGLQDIAIYDSFGHHGEAFFEAEWHMEVEIKQRV